MRIGALLVAIAGGLLPLCAGCAPGRGGGPTPAYDTEAVMPAVSGYGPAYAIPDAAKLPEPPDGQYKVLIDCTRSIQEPAAPCSGVTHAARLLNALATAGVQPDRVRMVLVFHGGSIDAILTDAAYRKRHGVNNPNLRALRKLKALGAEVLICGQSLHFNNIPRASIAEEARVALSAMNVLIAYQQQGYALLSY